MAIELGVLLGQYRGHMSFEDVGSWSKDADQTSFSLQSTDVHSSPMGALLEVWSYGGPNERALAYLHNEGASDLGARLSTEVDTHRYVMTGWGRIDTAENSADLFARIGQVGQAVGIPHHDSELQPFRVERVGTDNGVWSAFHRMASAGSYAAYLDDILTAADVVDLYPGWDTRDTRELRVARHATVGGRAAAFPWFDRPRWELPLVHVPSSEAAAMNRWWANAWNLVFRHDTSDTAAVAIVRLGGPVPPFSQMGRPYPDRWQGTLLLEGIKPGGTLWF